MQQIDIAVRTNGSIARTHKPVANVGGSILRFALLGFAAGFFIFRLVNLLYEPGPELPPDPCDTTIPLVADAACVFPSPCPKLNLRPVSAQSD
jgi:hypothetical protein